MKKKSLLLVVALLALSGLMAAMAFTTANVKSDMTFNVVNTQDALLAIEGNEQHAAIGYGGSAKFLKINLNKGFGGEEFGLQQRSEYTWDNLFKVTNNSENPIVVKVKLTDKDKKNPKNTGGSFQGINIYARTEEGNWGRIAGYHGAGDGQISFQLKPDDSKWIGIKIENIYGSNKSAKPYSFNLIVDAEAVMIVE